MAAEPLTLYDISPGRTIAERYTVVGPHRQGGFTTAFEVTDGEDGARCEMQFFPANLFESRTQANQFRDRLRPWCDVSSEAVIDVRDVLDVDEENLALVTRFPEGESLRERLNREERLSREEVLAIGMNLMQGLEEVHGRELVHGDIKPKTIHLRGVGVDARPVLVDCGVTPGLWTAKGLGEKTQLIGTPYYAPFESFGGDAPDVRSDIYNVATVLFECLTGVLPWAGSSFLEVFQAKLLDPPPMSQRAPDVEVDAALEEAIRRGCLADRNQRYESAAEFRAKLGELV